MAEKYEQQSKCENLADPNQNEAEYHTNLYITQVTFTQNNCYTIEKSYSVPQLIYKPIHPILQY